MKKAVVIFVLLVVLTLAFTSVAYADAHLRGLPGAHGVTGREFGGLVAEKAQTDTFWLVEHVGGYVP